LMKVERALLDPEGLGGRPWFKHLIYAPRPTYKPLILPALTEAIEAPRSVAREIRGCASHSRAQACGVGN
jgi:N-acetylated-alpha-linked acidic dipeptidase